MKSTKTYGERKISKIDPQEFLKQQFGLLIDILKKELPKFKEINATVLFGSFARGDYSLRHSDIDIMIFLNKLEEDRTLEEKIRKKIISLNLGQELNVHILFQYLRIGEEDKSLMLTVADEGKVIFAKETLVISNELLGLKSYFLIRFDTAQAEPVVKNKLQRFLHGYTIKGKKYIGIIDEERVLSAGKGAIIVPQELLKKVLFFAQQIGIKAVQKAKFYR
ncbi:MAG: nucleotidyltransferase domain-containing protein [Candidatus Woesearchaeota archaeon]